MYEQQQVKERIHNMPLQMKAEDYSSPAKKAKHNPYEGVPLNVSGKLATRIKQSFGINAGELKLRESPEVSEMGARATAQGNAIRFAPGEFKPDTREGMEVLGHELAHVREQATGGIHAPRGEVFEHPRHEAASDKAGEAFAGGSLSAAAPVSVGGMNAGAAPVQMLPGFMKRIKESWNYGRAIKRKNQGIKNAMMEQQTQITQAQENSKLGDIETTISSGTNRNAFDDVRKDRRALQMKSNNQTENISLYGRLTGQVNIADNFRKKSGSGESFISKLASGRLRESSRRRQNQRMQQFSTGGMTEEERTRLTEMTEAGNALGSAKALRTARSNEADTFARTRMGLTNDLSSIEGGRQVQGLFEVAPEGETDEQRTQRLNRNAKNYPAIINAKSAPPNTILSQEDSDAVTVLAAPIVQGVTEASETDPANFNNLEWVKQNFLRLSNLSSQAMLISDITKNLDQKHHDMVYPEGKEAYKPKFDRFQGFVKRMIVTLEEHSGRSNKE